MPGIKRDSSGRFTPTGRAAPPTASSAPRQTAPSAPASPSNSSASSYQNLYASFHALEGQAAETRQVERALGDHTMREGDVLVVNGSADGQPTSYRYKVIKRTAKTATVRMIRMNGTLGDPETLRIQEPGGNEYLKMHGGYHRAYPER